MTLAFFCVSLLCAKLCSDNLSCLILRTTQWGRCHYLHFTDEEVKAQRAQTTASIWCTQLGDTLTHSLSHLLIDFLSISIDASVYPFIWIDNIFSWLKLKRFKMVHAEKSVSPLSPTSPRHHPVPISGGKQYFGLPGYPSLGMSCTHTSKCTSVPSYFYMEGSTPHTLFYPYGFSLAYFGALLFSFTQGPYCSILPIHIGKQTRSESLSL